MYRQDDCICESLDDSLINSEERYMHKSTEDCMCKSKEYARAYIIPQKYENLFSCKEGFLMGTIFKDLHRPYHDHKHEHEHDHECKKNKCER